MCLHTFPLNPFVREVEGCGKYDCASKIHTVLRIASPVCKYSVVLWTVGLSWDAMDAMDAMDAK